MVNDTISDLLTRIRNANLASHGTVSILNTKMNYSISEILKTEGYIADLTPPNKNDLMFEIKLKYIGTDKVPCITNLKRLSSPGLRLYSHTKDIPRILNGMGVVILSTSMGIMTDRDAKRKKIGGELLCSIW
uniref:Ribosomal protein S8 n=1 Tax=Capsosiphon fulvescens TaxID=205396 RepID=A0A3G5ART9_9CHLO|nr:ribosomal protein S8 [Capsosiphon fulvescens]AWX64073.1 ribosomal protein S8 [Capsosiphon fulvescens]AYV89990.1 ribosomal protein S8 [Capsosiphon fulvescens]